MKTTTQLFGIIILTLGVLFQTQAQDPFTNGLVAYYPFNGNANDASGNGNNGVVYGTTLVVDRFGRTNNAMDFGIGNYIEVASTAQLKFSIQFTVMAWIKANSFADAHTIVSKNFSDGWSGWEFIIGGGSASIGNLTVEGNFGGQNTAGGVQISGTNQWQHVAAIYDGGSMLMEVNGVVVAPSLSVGQFSGAALVNDAPLRFGRRDSPNDDWFLGQIDDIRIYNRALSVSEVQELYQIETGGHTDIAKAVRLDFTQLLAGWNYQVQFSHDLTNWTNSGSAFTATSSTNSQYMDVTDWNTFWRLKVAP